jgi:hypothetical protein
MSNNSQNSFNVNSYFQKGGITAGQVNIGKQERHFTEQTKQALIPHLPDKKDVIDLTVVMGDQEAFQFASEIKQFLENENYNVNGVNQAIFSKPVKGQIIEPRKEGGIKIIIGGA